MNAIEIIDISTLERHLFEGAGHAGIPISFFVVDMAPSGGGNRPRVHPYLDAR